MSVVTFQNFIVMQMTPSFIYRLTQAVLLVKMSQLDQWKPVSWTLSSGRPRTNLCLMTTKPSLFQKHHDIYFKRLLLTLSGSDIAM